jgi:hypothetical protein
MKVDGSLGSLVQGVSQQGPSERRLGQHTAQVNMRADPVRGLSRRHGSLWLAETDLQLDELNAAANLTDSNGYRSFDYTSEGRDLTIMYRAAAQASGADMPPVIVYDKTNQEFLSVVRNGSDTLLDTLASGGVSAIAAVGKYVFMAGNSIVPAGTSTPAWADATNQALTVAWVRGGAYSRTYRATVTRVDNSQVTFSYTTPASSYPGTLDTSGVPVYAAAPGGGTTADTEAAYITLGIGGFGIATLGWAAWNPTGMSITNGISAMSNVSPSDPVSASQYRWDAGSSFVKFHSSLIGATAVTMSYTHTSTVANPNYAKAVADITNAYQTAVTNWIGTSAAAVQPQNIAASLASAATGAGLTGVSVVGSTVVFTGIKDITTSDGGDGTLFKGLANTVQSVADLTDAHFVGKVVRVSPTGGESFYMKATAKNPSITSGVTEALWVEGAGISRTIDSALVYGVASGSSFYIAGSATLLNAILPGTHPTYAPATVGDDDSSPMPHFVTRKISYLGVFQDRLLIGSGAVIRCSKIGDYLNFFRSSVLTIPADDPLEMLSQGSEDDTIRFSVLYDRDLILFGNKRQYAVSGRVALTPTSANMPVMSSHEGASDAQPLAAGGLIFYAKEGQASTSVHQIEPGRNAESPESFPASSQLDDYMVGTPVELTVIPKPSTLLVRTSGARSSLFVFSYLDSNERRLQDCWDRWDYDAALGPILGTTVTRQGVIVFTLRQAEDDEGNLVQYAVADLQPLDSQLSTRPYLDSLRRWEDVVAAPGSVHSESPGFAAAYADGTDSFLLGTDSLAGVPDLLDDLGDVEHLWVGMPAAAYWSPTNPFVRDGEGKALTTGRLVVTKLVIAFRFSSGWRSVVTAHGLDNEESFNGRILGDPNNVIGQVPVTQGKWSVVIGRDSSEYEQTIHAHSWLPLNITSVDWIGQSFHRPQRVG